MFGLCVLFRSFEFGSLKMFCLEERRTIKTVVSFEFLLSVLTKSKKLKSCFKTKKYLVFGLLSFVYEKVKPQKWELRQKMGKTFSHTKKQSNVFKVFQNVLQENSEGGMEEVGCGERLAFSFEFRFCFQFFEFWAFYFGFFCFFFEHVSFIWSLSFHKKTSKFWDAPWDAQLQCERTSVWWLSLDSFEQSPAVNMCRCATMMCTHLWTHSWPSTRARVDSFCPHRNFRHTCACHAIVRLHALDVFSDCFSTCSRKACADRDPCTNVVCSFHSCADLTSSRCCSQPPILLRADIDLWRSTLDCLQKAALPGCPVDAIPRFSAERFSASDQPQRHVRHSVTRDAFLNPWHLRSPWSHSPNCDTHTSWFLRYHCVSRAWSLLLPCLRVCAPLGLWVPWSQPVVASSGHPKELLCSKSLWLAVVTALAGAWWSVGTLDSVTRILIDWSACLVEPCALSMPVRVQQQAHRRRVRGHRSQLSVVRPGARYSSSRAECSIVSLAPWWRWSSLKADVILNLIHTWSHQGGLKDVINVLRTVARAASSCFSSRRIGWLRSWCRHCLSGSGTRW